MSALKYIAYAAVGLAGFFVVKRIVAPPSTAPVTTSPLAGIVSGVKGLVALATSGGSAPSSPPSVQLFHESSDPATQRAQQGTPIGAPLGASPVSNYAVATADGDSYISDANGLQTTTGTTPQPTTFTTYEQRATAGALPSALYGLAPSNIAAR